MKKKIITKKLGKSRRNRAGHPHTLPLTLRGGARVQSRAEGVPGGALRPAKRPRCESDLTTSTLGTCRAHFRAQGSAPLSCGLGGPPDKITKSLTPSNTHTRGEPPKSRIYL